MSDRSIKRDILLKKNNQIILSLLSADERKLIERLVEKDGVASQYELSYLPDINKVKAHRILRSLKEKRIVKKEKKGKINTIVLDEGLLEILKRRD